MAEGITQEQLQTLASAYLVLLDVLLRAQRQSCGVTITAVESLDAPVLLDNVNGSHLYLPRLSDKFGADDLLRSLAGCPVVPPGSLEQHASNEALYLWRSSRYHHTAVLTLLANYLDRTRNAASDVAGSGAQG